MKLKTKKSALKRFKIKKHVIIHKKAYKSHLLRKKTSNQLRNLSRSKCVNKPDLCLLKPALVC